MFAAAPDPTAAKTLVRTLDGAEQLAHKVIKRRAYCTICQAVDIKRLDTEIDLHTDHRLSTAYIGYSGLRFCARI